MPGRSAATPRSAAHLPRLFVSSVQPQTNDPFNPFRTFQCSLVSLLVVGPAVELPSPATFRALLRWKALLEEQRASAR